MEYSSSLPGTRCCWRRSKTMLVLTVHWENNVRLLYSKWGRNTGRCRISWRQRDSKVSQHTMYMHSPGMRMSMYVTPQLYSCVMRWRGWLLVWGLFQRPTRQWRTTFPSHAGPQRRQPQTSLRLRKISSIRYINLQFISAAQCHSFNFQLICSACTCEAYICFVLC